MILLALVGYGVTVTAASVELRDLQRLSELRTAHAWKQSSGSFAVDPDQYRYIE